MVGYVVYITAETIEPGYARSLSIPNLDPGRITRGFDSRINDLCAILRRASIKAELSTDIRDDVWTKLVANMSSNPIPVIATAPLEDIYRAVELRQLHAAIFSEVKGWPLTMGRR
jgi:2-dehydropantoate 2-reductase